MTEPRLADDSVRLQAENNVCVRVCVCVSGAGEGGGGSRRECHPKASSVASGFHKIWGLEFHGFWYFSLTIFNYGSFCKVISKAKN